MERRIRRRPLQRQLESHSRVGSAVAYNNEQTSIRLAAHAASSATVRAA
jgi:hypothetical protein